MRKNYNKKYFAKKKNLKKFNNLNYLNQSLSLRKNQKYIKKR